MNAHLRVFSVPFPFPLLGSHKSLKIKMNYPLEGEGFGVVQGGIWGLEGRDLGLLGGGSWGIKGENNILT